MNRRRRILLTVAWLAFAALLVGSERFYAATFSTPYMAYLLLGIAYLHLSLRPRWSEAGWIAVGGAALCFLDLGWRGWPAHAASVASLFGFAGFVLLGLRALAARQPSLAARRLDYAFAGAVLFFFSDWLATTFLTISNGLHAHLLDAYLLAFDRSLRLPLGPGLEAAFREFAALRVLSLGFYFAIAALGAVIFAAHLRRDLRRAAEVGVGFLLAGPIGALVYNLFPAIGPAHAFPAGSGAFAAAPAPAVGHGVVNAMPSLHLAWVLLAWWYARGLAWPYRALAGVFFTFVALATLGSGEHYVADLVVAFPFALIVEGLAAFAEPGARRIAHIALGLGLTLGWLALLRHAPALFSVSPAVPWLLTLATLAGVLWASRPAAEAGARPQGRVKHPLAQATR